MEECCTTCKKRYALERWDYTDVHNNGVPKTRMEGFACTCFIDEGIVIWQVGSDPKTGMCECYEPKEVYREGIE